MELNIETYKEARPTIIKYSGEDMKLVHCIDVLDHRESNQEGLFNIYMLIAYIDGNLSERTYLGSVEQEEIGGVITTIYTPLELI